MLNRKNSLFNSYLMLYSCIVNRIQININYLRNVQTYEWLRRNNIHISENQRRLEMNKKLNEDTSWSVAPKRIITKPEIDEEYFKRK
jgi:hypothetical protein